MMEIVELEYKTVGCLDMNMTCKEIKLTPTIGVTFASGRCCWYLITTNSLFVRDDSKLLDICIHIDECHGSIGTSRETFRKLTYVSANTVVSGTAGIVENEEMCHDRTDLSR